MFLLIYIVANVCFMFSHRNVFVQKIFYFRGMWKKITRHKTIPVVTVFFLIRFLDVSFQERNHFNMVALILVRGNTDLLQAERGGGGVERICPGRPPN